MRPGEGKLHDGPVAQRFAECPCGSAAGNATVRAVLPFDIGSTERIFRRLLPKQNRTASFPEMRGLSWPSRSSSALKGETVFDPDFDIDDGGLPREKPVLPKK